MEERERKQRKDTDLYGAVAAADVAVAEGPRVDIVGLLALEAVSCIICKRLSSVANALSVRYCRFREMTYDKPEVELVRVLFIRISN